MLDERTINNETKIKTAITAMLVEGWSVSRIELQAYYITGNA